MKLRETPKRHRRVGRVGPGTAKGKQRSHLSTEVKYNNGTTTTGITTL